MRIYSCSVCGRPGRRRLFWLGGSSPVCRDSDACYRRFALKRRIAAMRTAEEEREMINREVQRRIAVILARCKTREAS